MKKLRQSLLTFASAGILLLFAASVMAIATSSHNLAAAPAECKVVIALDRSASIADNWTALRGQVLALFDLNGLSDRNDISLAIWTFSHVSNAGNSNFNAPYHDYVQTNSLGRNAFENTLPVDGDDILAGQTNYAQGFGYNVSSVSPLALAQNSNSDIRSIASQANVVAFLTDGAPNYPGGGDNNLSAVAAGRAARNEYAPNIPIIGGYINADPNSNYVPLSLYRVINGNDDTSAPNIGPLGFNSLKDYLVPRIKDACKIDLPDYELTPHANLGSRTTSAQVQVDDKVTFDYSVDKTGADSGTSKWQAYDVTVNPGVANPLYFGTSSSGCTTDSNKPYCSSTNTANDKCPEIRAIIGGRGTCQSVTDRGSGTETFTSSDNQFYDPEREVTVGNLPVGTQICSVLVLYSPTATGGAARISSAACVTIAKSPLVQMYGGDVIAGRKFTSDNSTLSIPSGIYASSFKVTGTALPTGRTYGSWVEYGALAPGPIKEIASSSGYAGENGGYDTPIASSNCYQATNVLTFSNTPGEDGSSVAHQPECGHYGGVLGSIPDVVSGLTARTAINPSSYTSPLKFDENSIAGLYEKDDEGASIQIGDGSSGGTSTIKNSATQKGKAFIIYVPNGTVTIASDIVQANDTYTSISDIPQLVIIARDIKIRDSVKQVDAWLVAPGTKDGEGIVNTCVNATGNTPKLSANVCNLDLRINGPIMARELRLWRTKVDRSDPSCRIDTITDCCDVGQPAETINLPGSSLLWAKGFGLNNSRAQTTYTTELPPFF